MRITHWKLHPIFGFTTNRNVNINGTTFSCHALDLTKYVKSKTLDGPGYNVRQFRLRLWLADQIFRVVFFFQQTKI